MCVCVCVLGACFCACRYLFVIFCVNVFVSIEAVDVEIFALSKCFLLTKIIISYHFSFFIFQVKLMHYPQGFHGFFMFAGGGWLKFNSSIEAMQDLVDFLNAHVFGIR